MYPDPKRIRCHRVTVRLDQYELELLTAIANYQGEQVSGLLRHVTVREALAVLDLSGHTTIADATAPRGRSIA